MKLSRRWFMQSTSATVLVLGVAMPLMTEKVFAAGTATNVCMETPTCLLFWCSDDDITLGNTIDVGAQTPGPTEPITWVQRINTGKPGTPTEWCATIGPTAAQFRFSDLPPATYRDFMALRVAGNYTVDAGGGDTLTVTAVYFRAGSNNGSGIYKTNSNGAGQFMISQRHEIMLQFNRAPTANATYTVTHSTGAVDSFTFTANDKQIRANALQVSHAGFRPNDPVKFAYMSSRLPGGPNFGVVDLQTLLGGSTTFHIVDDATRTIAYTGSFTLRSQYNTPQPNDGQPLMDIADLENPITIQQITRGNPTTSIRADGGNWQTGDKVRFRGINGLSLVNVFALDASYPNAAQSWGAWPITRVDDDNFTIALNSLALSAFNATGIYDAALGGVNNTVYKCFSANRSATNVYGFEFPNFNTPGTWRLYVPGFGVSDPWPIAHDVYDTMASLHHRGVASLRLGCPVDNGDYQRPQGNIRDGINGCTNYWSTMPAIFGSEYASKFDGATLGTGEWWLRNYEIETAGSGYAVDDVITLTTGTELLVKAVGGTGNVTYAIITKFSTFTAAPTNPVSQSSTTGAGTGATFNLLSGAPTLSSGIAAYDVGAWSGGTNYAPGFITLDRAANTWLGNQDAGDNDDIGADHIGGWGGLAWTFGQLSNSARYTTYQVATCLDLGLDPVLFAGTQDLPSIFQELFWFGETWRLTQFTTGPRTGAVAGGLSLGHFTAQVANYPEAIQQYQGTDAGGETPTGQRVFGCVNAPDHLATGLWAYAAFTLARIAKDYGLTALEAAYATSAQLAYDWFYSLLTDVSARDAYYVGDLDVKNKFGWTERSYQAAMEIINRRVESVVPYINGCRYRYLGSVAGATDKNWFENTRLCTTATVSSGGSGYVLGDVLTLSGGINPIQLRVTGVSAGAITAVSIMFGGNFQTGSIPSNPVAVASSTGSGTGATFNCGTINNNFRYTQNNVQGTQAGFDYWITTPGSTTAKTTIGNNFFNDASRPAFWTDTALAYNFPGLPGFSGAGLNVGLPNYPVVTVEAIKHILGWTHAQIRANQWLQSMYRTTAFIYGANMYNTSWITGHGPRPLKWILHEDSFAMGMKVPDGIGIYAYEAWGVPGNSFYNYVVSTVDGGPISFNTMNITSGFESEPTPGSHKMGQPWPQGLSYWEWYVQQKYMIFKNEFDIVKNLGILSASLYLKGWDDAGRSWWPRKSP